jgi:hypothetical protein
MAKPILCVNCGEKPAVSSSDTVPLCAACKQQAKGKERGVKMAPKTKTRNEKLAAVR